MLAGITCRPWFRYVPLTCCVLGFALLLVACDPGEDFTYKNDANELLFVQVNNGSINRLPPGTTRAISHLTSLIGTGDDLLKFVVRDERGCIVLRMETTLLEFREELDLTLAITPSDLPPPEERTDCEQAG